VNEKINLCIEIAKKQCLVDFEFNHEQSAVHEIFLCSDLENFRQIQCVSTMCRF